MKAMVLAAGKGTRLMPLTSEVPKPLAPVAGKPIMEYTFELLAQAGVDEAHVNICYLADVILEHYGQEAWINGMTVEFSREERLMGTAGGVGRLADRFGETFVVIMGDALTDVDLEEVVAFHKQKGALATLALMRVDDTSRYGVVELDREGNVMDFQEKPRPQDAISDLANTGIYVLEPEVLDYVPRDAFSDFAEDVFPRLLAAGVKFVGYEGEFYWSDVGTLEAYREAQRDALSGEVRVKVPGEHGRESLWVGRSARLHPTAAFNGRAAIGRDAVIGSGVTLSGDVTVGSGCHVHAGATIERSILLPGSRVGEDARLEDCIVGPGYSVGPGDWIQGEVLVQGAPARNTRPFLTAVG